MYYKNMQTYILRTTSGNKNSESSAPSRFIKGESAMAMTIGEKSNKPDPQTVVTTNLKEVTIEVKKEDKS